MIWGFVMSNWLSKTLGINVLPPTVSSKFSYSPTLAKIPKVLKVLVWNYYKGSKDKDSEQLKTLLWQEPIVGLFQELGHTPKNIDLSSYYVYHAPTWQKQNKFQTGLSIISSIPLKDSQNIHSECTEPFIQTPKAIQTAYYEAWNLKIIQIHAINFVRNHCLKKQLIQLEGEINNHIGPLIVAGDFNTWSSSRYALLKDLLKRTSLKTPEYKTDHRVTKMSFPLDHFFYKKLKLISCESFRVETSDHNPILCEVSL